MGQLGFGFSLVHSGVGTRVEDPIGLMAFDRSPTGSGIGEIQRFHPCSTGSAGGDQLNGIGPGVPQCLAQLACSSCEQDFHGKTSPRLAAVARSAASASFSERLTAALPN